MTTLADVRRRALLALMPPPRLRLSEWVESELILPEGVSSAPGRVRLWPYQRDIADAISDPLIERVTLVKSTRLGFTTLLTAAIGAYVANDPAPILAVLPTEADCRDYVVSDVEPIFAASPALRGALTIEDAEEDRNTLLSRRFPGGSLKVVASRAPRNLRRHTARVLMVDEADACESGPEGNPIRLAERRTLSFANRKIIVGSTPIFEDTSHVLRAYAVSDQRVYECPCPACGGYTEITWAHIEWEPDHPETAGFRCPHCAALVAEREKFGMVSAGRWRITHPEAKGHAGFRCNALVSLLANASWSRLAAEFLAAKDDPAELQVFVNTVLAQGWNEAETEIDDAALAARAEPFGLDRIPPEVLVLTAGCDLQDDRIEISICGWTREGACLVLGHIVIYGTTDDETLWLEVDQLLRTKWKHPHGGSLRLDAAAIDAGDGEHFDRVCRFCAPRASRRVMATKGAAGPRPAIAASHSKMRNGGRLWIVGIDGIKGNIFNRLSRGSTIRFSDSLDAAYFDQVCSERRVTRYARGRPVRRFERLPGKRAEGLDCLVYATAARSAAPIQLDQRFDDLHRVDPPPTHRPSVIRSRFMER
jgi:phage terminase large subunit GpA-like protein